MFFTAIAWFLGLSLLLFFLVLFLQRGNIFAIAVLAILIPAVFARPAIFLCGLDELYPNEYFHGMEWIAVSKGLLAAGIWIVLFSLTHYFFFRPLIPLGRLLPQAPKRFSLVILFMAAAFTTVLGAVLTGRLVLSAGSVPQFMYNVKVGKELAGSYIIREISVTGAIFSAVAMLYYEKRCRAGMAQKYGRLLFWVCVALFATNLLFNYFWGNRYNIAMLMLSLGLAWHFCVSRIRLIRLIVLVLIAGSLLQGLKLYRNASVEEAWGHELQHSQSFWLDLSNSLHLTEFDAFVLALRDAGDRFEFRNGKDFINGLLAWIPREFYPEKETYNVGKWFRQVYQPNVENGWPVTTIGSWYVNFGPFGILFGGMFSGIVAALFDAGYKNVRRSPWQAIVATSMAFLMFQGGVGTGFVISLVTVMVPIYLLAGLLRFFKTRSLQNSADDDGIEYEVDELELEQTPD